MSEERLLSVADVAERIGVHRNTVYNWVKDGVFPQPVALGALTRWKLSEVLAWIEARERR